MLKIVNAKINLGLRVLRRRPDGYHDLDTLFYPIGKYAGTPYDPGTLADVLELTRAADDTLIVDSVQDCGPMERNLVWRALQAYRAECPNTPAMQMVLQKHIPSQAGLGGGSADAAFTLMALNELNPAPLSEDALHRIALSLGADCPFFLINKPSLATGVGERLRPVQIDLSGLWAAVVRPQQGISTAQAFAHVSPSEHGPSIEDVVNMPLHSWARHLVNDFEASAYAVHPHLRSIKEALYRHGALYASMSGSGSAFYGIYEDKASAMRAIEKIDTPWGTVARL